MGFLRTFGSSAKPCNLRFDRRRSYVRGGVASIAAGATAGAGLAATSMVELATDAVMGIAGTATRCCKQGCPPRLTNTITLAPLGNLSLLTAFIVAVEKRL